MRAPARLAGFTLLEVMVVVVIIAVLTTVGVLSIGLLGRDSGLDAEGDRYSDVIAAASEQAQLEGRDYGLWFGAAAYQVYARDEARDRWEALEDDRLYARHEWPSGIEAALEMEGRPVPPATETPTSPPVPQVVLFASGETTPYRLALRREGTDHEWRVDGEADGTLVVTHPGQEPPAVAPTPAGRAP